MVGKRFGAEGKRGVLGFIAMFVATIVIVVILVVMIVASVFVKDKVRESDNFGVQNEEATGVDDVFDYMVGYRDFVEVKFLVEGGKELSEVVKDEG